MSGTITRAAYQQLVDEDICWLERQPRTLERDHVIDIVRHSVEVYYGELRDLRAQVAQLALELTGCRDLIATLRSRVAERECDLTRIAEAQRPHCTTECIEGVWWAKGKSGGVYGPHSTEREALLEVAEMGRSEQLKADAP